MKKIFVGLGIAVSVLIAVMGFVAYKQVRSQSSVPLEVISEQNKEGRDLFKMCQGAVASTMAGITDGTAHFDEILSTDPARAKKVLVDVVMPVVASREFACSTAREDIAAVRKASTKPDAFLEGAVPVVERELAKLTTIHANGDALAAALEAKASYNELMSKYVTFATPP
jgi:hypothetical protein